MANAPMGVMMDEQQIEYMNQLKQGRDILNDLVEELSSVACSGVGTALAEAVGLIAASILRLKPAPTLNSA
jgi:hypothetical protein